MTINPTKSSKCRRCRSFSEPGLSFLFESTSKNFPARFKKYFSRTFFFASLNISQTAQENLSTSLRKKLSQMLMLVTLGVSQTVFSIEVRDDEGLLVQLDKSAERIISLAPSLTELLYAAGAGDKLVGVVEYSDYPSAAKELPIIGR